jgi:hypothetical protein
MITLEIGSRHTLAPKDLTPHALTAHQPWMGAARFELFAAALREEGIHEDLLITPSGEIANGRHRWKSFNVPAHRSQACLPCRVVAEGVVPQIILDTTIQRRHLSKSARAFIALDLIGEAVRLAEEQRKKKLKTGTHLSREPINRVTGKEGSPLQQLATLLDISTDMLTLARNTERLFTKSDELLTKWREMNPEPTEQWENRDPERWADWADFRVRYLLDVGFQGNPQSGEAAAVIPEDYREIYTARLFSDADADDAEGPMSLGAINKALGGIFATKGKQRPDTNPDTPGLRYGLLNKLNSFSKTMFAEPVWDGLTAEDRLSLAGEIGSRAATWPLEVRIQIAAALKEAASKKVINA